MPAICIKSIEGYKQLAGRMILRAMRDLDCSEHCQEVMAWINGTDAHLTFQHCAHMLDLDEEALRQFILNKTINN